MSRRERRGAIVVMALIALLLVLTVAVRSCSGRMPEEVVSADLPQFEAQVDSAMSHENDKTSSTVAKKKSSSKRKKPRPHADKKPKPSPGTRPLNPVPQF